MGSRDKTWRRAAEDIWKQESGFRPTCQRSGTPNVLLIGPLAAPQEVATGNRQEEVVSTAAAPALDKLSCEQMQRDAGQRTRRNEEPQSEEVAGCGWQLQQMMLQNRTNPFTCDDF
ncbi:uncharacterized protein LOC120447118 isoform X2 [Drosophila santomea]|uniref:uncharacterized protein LOC120447118 isoform X2 n=1 Tax=Drosophila santomea TaxID=129105 RepID=UPI001954FC6B|nr:uncharacterized protein LOC120447118 isoform X2 [Drosophila santomea]XP_039484481.1 uncharacterized protein LOC120447118 isoform X2 [Drosophila santomea]